MSVRPEILYSWPGNFFYSHPMTISLIDKSFKDQRDLIHQIPSLSEKPKWWHPPKASLMLLLLTVASWSLVPRTQEPSFWPRAYFGTVYFNPPTRVALPRHESNNPLNEVLWAVASHSKFRVLPLAYNPSVLCPMVHPSIQYVYREPPGDCPHLFNACVQLSPSQDSPDSLFFINCLFDNPFPSPSVCSTSSPY